MEAHQQIPYLREAVVFLVATVAIVPLFQRLRASPVLGYLAIGALIGPYGLGRLAEIHPWLGYFVIADADLVRRFAELGIVLLLFVIGLGLSVDRVWSMRRTVFGLGLAQVLVCGGAIGLAAWTLGTAPPAATVLGACLAMSSTAVVVQLLTERGEIATRLGRAAIAVLLFQDLAVVPILFLLSVLGGDGTHGVLPELGIALARAIVAVGLILALGRLLLRPVFRRIAQLRSQGLFVALSLLAVIGTGWLTGMAGLSMALGAFLAGLVLAETEFRHQIEMEIAPFKELLLSLFFVSIGMTIDLLVMAAHILPLVLAVIGLFAVKALIIAALGRAFRLPAHVALPLGLLLGQGGEFGFLIVGLAIINGVLPAETGRFAAMAVALTMALTPLAALLARIVERRLRRHVRHHDSPEPPEDLGDLDGHVVIAGMGRVGEVVAMALEARQMPYVAVDLDAAGVARQRKEGRLVYFGDASRHELLARLGLERAAAVVITLDDPDIACRSIGCLRDNWPDLRIYARARDAEHARLLLDTGATHVVPETVEASLQLAEHVLEDLGVSKDTADELVDELRGEILVALREAQKEQAPRA
ncbi:MAG: cation:proton antiporter [Alphaproteobacteria bacterium]|nr:cation:proton antiporter [Alphaproteobacteria bacterium]